jgi:D-serine deaminase-like pyridoxal phosphate-dependent protein
MSGFHLLGREILAVTAFMDQLTTSIEAWDQLPTPSLVLSGEKVRRNVQRLADYAAKSKLSIRPHTKTHKLRHLAQLQLAAGANGLTAAKVSEAEVISEPGEDVLLAYPPVGRFRADRIAQLARSRTVRAALDSLAAVEMMSAAASEANTTVGLLVDIDVGLGRTGVQTPAESLALAQAVDRAPNVRLDGIMIYPGHIWELPDQQSGPMKAVSGLLQETLDLWGRHGLSAAIVSGGSTPTAYQSHLIPEMTEIRPGTYVFNDMNTVRGGFCTLDDCAAFVIATVISDAVPGQVVIDAGSKTLTKDPNVTKADSGFGHVVEFPEARISKLSEEHAQIDINMCGAKPAVGTRVSVIPNHICPCVNLQNVVWWFELNERPRPMNVDARGKLQ